MTKSEEDLLLYVPPKKKADVLFIIIFFFTKKSLGSQFSVPRYGHGVHIPHECVDTDDLPPGPPRGGNEERIKITLDFF